MSNVETVKKQVQNYYGKILQSKADLQTSACCLADDVPQEHKQILSKLHPEILEKFYGCGSPIPASLEGCTVLDLGCGTGRDAYLLSQLVGPKGRVIGVDMTDEQLAVARKHQEYHREQFAYEHSNVDFRKGYIEDLQALDIADASVDVVISNCVINLSPAKESVFSEIFRVLKPGGELYFSDVFSDRRIPEQVQKDPVLLGECLGGAMYVEDFRRMLARLGCKDFRQISNSVLTVDNQDLRDRVGNINFTSKTVRCFKLDLEDLCENFGQAAIYEGGLADSPNVFVLDDHHMFTNGKAMPVCGNTADMLSQTRFQKHFRILGDKSVHYGVFDCAPASDIESTTSTGACC